MKKTLVLAGIALASLVSQANAAIVYDADVTNNVIMGSGVTNGSFTVLREGGIELGLRGKVRHNAAGNPENVYNSNGDGTYNFEAGSAVGQMDPSTANWSFEFSVNTSFDLSTKNRLSDLSYILQIDSDPSLGTSFIGFDPIAPGAHPDGYWDHSIGSNMTAQGAGVEATNILEYQDLIGNNTLAQNSWKPHWFIPGFDPTVDGVYTINFGIAQNQIAFQTVSIDIIVGEGASEVSAPAVASLLGLGFMGLAFRRKQQAKS